MIVNDKGYVTTINGKNVWLIKYNNNRSTRGLLNIGCVCFPKAYVGKRVRLKIEVVDE